jgi:hypothetical protein
MKNDSRWSGATAEDDGRPLIFRIRNEAPSFANKSTFRHLLAVSWRYDSPNDQEMSSPSDSQRMSEFEDLLEAGLEGVSEAFLSVIVTGNGVREWQWYARDPENIMELVNETLGHLEPFPVQFSCQDGPEWQGYSRFLRIAGLEAPGTPL